MYVSILYLFTFTYHVCGILPCGPKSQSPGSSFADIVLANPHYKYTETVLINYNKKSKTSEKCKIWEIYNKFVQTCINKCMHTYTFSVTCSLY